MRPQSRRAVAKKTSTRKQDAGAFRLKQERIFVRQKLLEWAKKSGIHHRLYEQYCTQKLPVVNEVLAEAAAIKFKSFTRWKGFIGDRLNKRLSPQREEVRPAVVPKDITHEELCLRIWNDAKQNGVS